MADITCSTPLELVDSDDLEPVEEQFRTGVMSLGWDPTTAQLVIEAHPLAEVEEDEEVLRVKMPVGTTRAFHSGHKLRTVLWGWTGAALSAEELAGIDRVLSGLEGELGRDLAKLLTPPPRKLPPSAPGCTGQGCSPLRAARCRQYPGRCSKAAGPHRYIGAPQSPHFVHEIIQGPTGSPPSPQEKQAGTYSRNGSEDNWK